MGKTFSISLETEIKKHFLELAKEEGEISLSQLINKILLLYLVSIKRITTEDMRLILEKTRHRWAKKPKTLEEKQKLVNSLHNGAINGK